MGSIPMHFRHFFIQFHHFATFFNNRLNAHHLHTIRIA